MLWVALFVGLLLGALSALPSSMSKFRKAESDDDEAGHTSFLKLGKEGDDEDGKPVLTKTIRELTSELERTEKMLTVKKTTLSVKEKALSVALNAKVEAEKKALELERQLKKMEMSLQRFAVSLRESRFCVAGKILLGSCCLTLDSHWFKLVQLACLVLISYTNNVRLSA